MKIIEAIYFQLLLDVIDGKIIPNISYNDWKDNKDEILEQFIGLAIESELL